MRIHTRMMQSTLDFRLVQLAVLVLIKVPEAGLHVCQEHVQPLKLCKIDCARPVIVMYPAPCPASIAHETIQSLTIAWDSSRAGSTVYCWSGLLPLPAEQIFTLWGCLEMQYLLFNKIAVGTSTTV